MPRFARNIALLWMVGALLGPSSAVAQTSVTQSMEMGKELYVEGRYRDAIAVVQALQAEELSKNNRVRALELEALCHFLLSDRRRAQQVWEQVLTLDPGHRLDPVNHSPEIVTFFERITPKRIADPASSDSPRELPETTEAVQTVSERGCGVVLCLIPFGGGQFANRRPGKGALFALLQAGFLSANVGLYYAREGNVGPGGFVQDEVKDRKQFRAQQAFFGLFVASVVTGIVDAYVFP